MEEQVLTDGNSTGMRCDGDASTLLNCTAKNMVKNSVVDSSIEGHSDVNQIIGDPELHKKTDNNLKHSHFDHILNGNAKNEQGRLSNESYGIADCNNSNDTEFGNTNSNQVSDELDAGVLSEDLTGILECKDQPVADTSENSCARVAATEKCEIIGDETGDAEPTAGACKLGEKLDKNSCISIETRAMDVVAMDAKDINLNNKVDLARSNDSSGGSEMESLKLDDVNSDKGKSSEASDVNDKLIAEEDMVAMATLLPVNENSLVAKEKGLVTEDSDGVMNEDVSESNKLADTGPGSENPKNETSQNESEHDVAMDTEESGDKSPTTDADLVEGGKESDIVTEETYMASSVDKLNVVAGSPVPNAEKNKAVEVNEEAMNVDDELSKYLLGDQSKTDSVGDYGTGVENVNSAEKTDFTTVIEVVESSSQNTNENMLIEESENVDVVSDFVESLHETFSTPTPKDNMTEVLMYESEYSQETANIMTDEQMYLQYSQGTAVYEADNSLKCQQCGTSYDTSEEFQEHIVGHLVQDSLTADTMDDDGWSTCPICLVMFPEFLLYEEHLKNHLNNVYKCTVCNKTFSERKDLEEHVNKVHNVDRPFKCSECGKMFKSVSMLGTHLRKIHGKELSARCDFCTMSFLTQDDLDFHMRLKHAKKLKKSGRKRKRQYTCKVCSRIYFDRKGFELHKRKGHRPVSVRILNASASSGQNISPLLGSSVSSSLSMGGRKISFIPLGGHREISSQGVGEAETFPAAVKQITDEEVKQTSDEHLKDNLTDKEVKKQTLSEDGSETGDDCTPSKRRRSQRVAYLESLVHGCELCDSRFATENDYRTHLKERHNSILNDYGEVVRLTRLENMIKRRRQSSQSSGKKSRKQRVQKLRDESEVSNSPRDSPTIFDKEEEDPSYEPEASSNDEEDDSPKPVRQTADVAADTKKSQPRVMPPHVDRQITNLPEGQTMRAWTCTICYLTFFKVLDLKSHVLNKHLKPIVHEAGYFWCPYCSKSFQTNKLLLKHINYYHSLKELLEKYSSKPNTVVPALSLTSCRICGLQFLGAIRLSEHMKKCHSGRHDPRQYNCHLCNKSFKEMDFLLTHIRSDHDQGQVNATPAAASIRSDQELPSSKPQTSIPNTSTSTTGDARKFYYACAVCEEGFNWESDLEDHIVSIHRLAIAPNRREKKPYGCLLCDKRFSQLNSITLHLVSYHKQDEHDIMGGRRKESEDDRRRMHQCLICLEYFAKKKFLDKHARRNNCRPSSQPKRPLPKKRVIVHDEGEKPLDCPKCSGKYWGKAYLYLHVLEVHGNAALGEFLLKKKIEDAAKEDFNDDTEEQEGLFPVAMYAAGKTPTPALPRRPLRGGFLPAGRMGKPTPVPENTVPKENSGTPDVIDLTDDDPVDKEPIPKLSIIKRPPGIQVAPTFGQLGRVHYHPTDRQHQPQRPGVPMNRSVQPGMVHQRLQTNRQVQQGGRPIVQMNSQGVVRPGAPSVGVRQSPTANQQVRQRLNQQIFGRVNAANGQNQAAELSRPNILRTGTSPRSSAGQPRPGSVAIASQARPVSSTITGTPRSVALSSGASLPTREKISNQPRQNPSAAQRPSQPPMKNTSGSKIPAVVDLTEDSDEEITDILVSPKCPAKILCIHCPEVFSEPLQMLIHVYSDHVKHNRYLCAFCEKTITNSQALQDHIKTHEQFKKIKSIIGSKDGLKLPSVFDEESTPEVIVL